MVDKDNVGKMADEDELERVLEKELGPAATDLFLVPTSGSPGSSLPYDQDAAWKYYSDYCSHGNECTSGGDGEFQLDCTHFVCHGLHKGNIKVNSPEAVCDTDLCIRVAELAAAFKNSVGRYTNVTRVPSFSQTKRGDFCFIVSWFGYSKDHAMVAGATVGENGGRVWGHTSHRCDTNTSWAGQTLIFYRIS